MLPHSRGMSPVREGGVEKCQNPTGRVMGKYQANCFMGSARTDSGKLPDYQNNLVSVLIKIKAVSDWLPTLLSHFISSDRKSVREASV